MPIRRHLRGISLTPPTNCLLFFFNYTATTEIYTLSLHDALPISRDLPPGGGADRRARQPRAAVHPGRSEEHTSELQSRENRVCRLLLAKKKRHKHAGGDVGQRSAEMPSLEPLRSL